MYSLLFWFSTYWWPMWSKYQCCLISSNRNKTYLAIPVCIIYLTDSLFLFVCLFCHISYTQMRKVAVDWTVRCLHVGIFCLNQRPPPPSLRWIQHTKASRVFSAIISEHNEASHRITTTITTKWVLAYLASVCTKSNKSIGDPLYCWCCLVGWCLLERAVWSLKKKKK